MPTDSTTRSLEDQKILAHETFQQTIQGEGYHQGRLVDFIRLAGCPVGCSFCDTGYSSSHTFVDAFSVTFAQIVSELKSPMVVVSGGEPFIHKNLSDLCQALLNAGRQVSIETSGVIYQEIPDAVWVTLSPKEHLGEEKRKVASAMWARANEVKIVVSDGSEVEFYRQQLEQLKETPCSLQPEWETQKTSYPITIQLIKQTNYRLSVQLHKMLGMP
jgi:organic radical activating enzyme